MSDERSERSERRSASPEVRTRKHEGPTSQRSFVLFHAHAQLASDACLARACIAREQQSASLCRPARGKLQVDGEESRREDAREGEEKNISDWRMKELRRNVVARERGTVRPGRSLLDGEELGLMRAESVK